MLIVAPATSEPGPTSTGNDSPVSSDWSSADSPSTTMPSVGIFSPGRTTIRSPGTTCSIGTETSTPSRSSARLLRSQLEQHANRLARAALGARLEVAAEEDQRRDHRGDLEVRVRVDAADEHDRRPEVGSERAEGDQGVHRRGEMARALQAPRGGSRSAPEHDGCREDERDPLPARELKRRDHGERRKRCSQRDGDDEAPPKNRRRLVVVVMRARVVNRMGVVPGALDRRHEVVDPHRLVAVDRRLLGGEVDGRLDAVELVELALDPAHARGAGHPVEIEADLLQGAGPSRVAVVTPPRTRLPRSQPEAPRRRGRCR